MLKNDDRKRSFGPLSTLRFLYKVRYAVGLYDHAMRGAVTERVTNRIAIRQEIIRRNLRLSDHATAQVVQKFQSGIGIPLSDAPTDDGFLRPGHADENVLIALGDGQPSSNTPLVATGGEIAGLILWRLSPTGGNRPAK